MLTFLRKEVFLPYFSLKDALFPADGGCKAPTSRRAYN